MIKEFPSFQMRGDEVQSCESDGFEAACARGAFYLKQPQWIDFSPGVRLAQSYYLPQSGAEDDAYRGFRNAPLDRSKLGYSNPKNDQVELLQIEAALWSLYLPADVARLLSQMNDLARTILKHFMLNIGVRAADIKVITGGMDQNTALQYCIFNHYRPDKQEALGFTAHKDSGFITLLYTTESGLECIEDQRWVPLDPKPGHLTVVLGHSLELLTAKMPRKVHANYHRVRTTHKRTATKADRFSYGVYIGPSWDQDLFQYNDLGALTPIISFIDFQKAKAAEMSYEFHPRVG